MEKRLENYYKIITIFLKISQRLIFLKIFESPSKSCFIRPLKVE